MSTTEATLQRKHELLDRIEALKARARSEGRYLSSDENATIQSLLAKAQKLQDNAQLDLDIAALGRQLTVGPGDGDGRYSGASFYDAIKAAGFDRKTHPAVAVPFMAVASFDGDYGTAVRVDRPAPALGADRRFLYPILRRSDVEPEATSVASFRAKSRTLPSPLSTMIRDIVATTDKPETDTETELVTEELKQIATVESGVPNIMLENRAFRDFIDFDLRFAYSSAVDAHVISQIAAAGPPGALPGSTDIEAILLAAELVAAAGYSPSVLVASPEELINLLLTLQPGGDEFVFSGNAPPIEGLRKVAVPGLTTPYVLDPDALGALHASPVRVQAFEENAGKTNTSLVRIESTGLFVVQRVEAAAEVLLGGS